MISCVRSIIRMEVGVQIQETTEILRNARTKKTKNKTSIMGEWKMNQSQGMPPCALIMPCVLIVPASKTAGSTAMPAGIS